MDSSTPTTNKEKRMIPLSKLWCRYLVILMAALLAALVLSALILYRFARNEAGICISENRIMSPEEHRKAFLRSLIQLGVRNSNLQEKIFRREAIITGIISDPAAPNFPRLIRGFYGNEISFEENFNIDVITPSKSLFDFSKVGDPFTLVTFRPSFGGGATFTYSQGVVKNEDLASIRLKHRPDLYARFRGFGNHYYNLTFTIISVECCDNRRHYRTDKEYINRKKNAYLASIGSMDRGFASNTKIAAASNCGEILTADSESNIGTQSIEWINL